MPKARHRTKQPNEVNFDGRSAMYQLAGTDLTQIHGIGPFLALRLVANAAPISRVGAQPNISRLG